ncbi:receptor-type tyrosine-protein phosphatase-like N isoform X2 [Denticeps clupeoides]|uniref:receptor-type tyrosine-protein phosphatase-like N isoform X2 n=1 Tax=Denticeps clupeoides TaxID=299321 RepID=UPI0010A5125E|nr:receptor-type tyrosine-protein phosphatase-like N isoform X2 [Denticeps clupeoides]
MGSPRLWVAMCVMMGACWRPGTPTRYGCLFEKRLCSREQMCADDGLFGQCQLPQQDQVQYQVSVPVLHRLQEVLKELMVQGLTWQDDITQYIIAKELSSVPQSNPSLETGPLDAPPAKAMDITDTSSKRQWLNSRFQEAPGEPKPNLAKHHLNYMIVDPPQTSLHMPGLDPYTYKQEYGYQDDEERSLNSVEGGRFPHASSRSRAGGVRHPHEHDRGRLQALQELVSPFLSSSAQTASRHRVAAPLSSSPFFPEMDFPLDYTDNYISQDLEVNNQPLDKKTPQDYGPLGKLDGETLKRMNALLQPHGFSLSPEQLESLSAALALLQTDSTDTNKQADRQGQSQDTPASPKMMKITEGSMTHVVEKASSPKLPTNPDSPGGKSTTQASPVQATTQEKKGVGYPSSAPGNEGGSPYAYIVTNQSVVGPAVTFRVQPNKHNLTASGVADKAVAEKNFLESETGLKILHSGVGEKNEGSALPVLSRVRDGTRWVFLTLVGVACVGGILVGALTIACLRNHANNLASGKLGLVPEAGSATLFEYQDLCRQHMAAKSLFSRVEGGAAGGGAGGGGGATDTSRVSSVSSQFSDAAQPSPSSHSSTPSWCEEPAQSNMDISTGHMILAYMEDHLKNKDRLLKEWEALCSYQAEPSTVSMAQNENNMKKNRCPGSVPYDHSRVKLKAEINPSRTDYINASTIIEHDPRMPAYIATQGPLSHTISDFWQMVWENGCTVIVMMTALVEDGEKQCDRYWPDEGSSLYHIYEVNLVSEHIWCNDFLVRSFYLKNVQTQETRTLTQFHFLSWPAQGIPNSTRPLLDFRRKVNKCYRGRSCPIIVHCSDGTGRTGTYILIDMVLNRMAKGVKEIDIAATLEHIRDQRPGMVRTKDQFEFALTAVAEEVNAILKALPQ